MGATVIWRDTQDCGSAFTGSEHMLSVSHRAPAGRASREGGKRRAQP